MRAHRWTLADSNARRVIFRKCDMSSWDDVLDLFAATWEAFGKIDVVIANAGIHSEGSWLADAVKSPTDKLVAPDMNTIRVNLDGTIFVTKCAMHYFARRPDCKTQLVFTGSAAR
jgi:NAD(P)-dependent dehydrogenase (short-subunit alcohol dehydrogenase family)